MMNAVDLIHPSGTTSPRFQTSVRVSDVYAIFVKGRVEVISGTIGPTLPPGGESGA